MTVKEKTADRVKDQLDNTDHFTDRLSLVIKMLGGVARTARIAGVAESTVRSWRDGNSEPQRPFLIPLANEAGVHLAWFVEGSLPIHRISTAQRAIAAAFDDYLKSSAFAGEKARLHFARDYQARIIGLPPAIYAEIPEIDRQQLVTWHRTYADELELLGINPENAAREDRGSYQANRLAEALQIIEEVLDEANLVLRAEKKAQLAVLVYQMLEEDGDVGKNKVFQLLKLAS